MIRLVRYWSVGIEESLGFSFDFRVPDPLEYHTDSRRTGAFLLPLVGLSKGQKTVSRDLQSVSTCFATCFAILVDQWWSCWCHSWTMFPSKSLGSLGLRCLVQPKASSALDAKGMERGVHRGVPWNILKPVWLTRKFVKVTPARRWISRPRLPNDPMRVCDSNRDLVREGVWLRHWSGFYVTQLAATVLHRFKCVSQSEFDAAAVVLFLMSDAISGHVSSFWCWQDQRYQSQWQLFASHRS